MLHGIGEVCDAAMKTQTLNLRVSEELRAGLDRVAKAVDRPRSWVVTQAIEEYLATQLWQIEEIEAGLREADAGDFASPEEVDAMFAELCGES